MDGRIIQVAKIPEREVKPSDAEELLETLVYYYSQYTYAAARRLPYRRVIRLIKQAEKMEAQKYYNLTRIAVAPLTKDGVGVQQLLKHFGDRATNA